MSREKRSVEWSTVAAGTMLALAKMNARLERQEKLLEKIGKRAPTHD